MSDAVKYRAIMQARVAELQARLKEIDGELDSHQSKDWEELATEREGDEVLEREGQMAQEEIARIEAAVARIDEGEFGYCVKCGDRISQERLDIVPYTPFCRNCAP